MANLIEHPTLGQIEFPDSMGDAEIVTAIQQLESQQAPAAPAQGSVPSVPAPQPQSAAPAPVAAPQPDPAIFRQPSTTERSTVTGMTAQEAQARGEFGASELQQAVRDVAPVAARYAPMVVAPAYGVGVGLSALGTAALTGLAAGTGEAVASTIENRSLRETAANTAQSTIAGSVGAPTMASMARPSASLLGALARTGQEAAEVGAQAYLGVAGGQAAAQAIRGQEVNMRDILTSTDSLLAAGLGTGIGAIAGAGGAVNQTLKYVNDARAAFSKIGVNKPTLTMALDLSPTSILSRAETLRTQTDPVFAQEVRDTLASVGSSMSEVLADVPRMDTITAALTPYADDIAKLRINLDTAKQKYQAARQTLQESTARMGAPTDSDLLAAESALYEKVAAESAMLDILKTAAPEAQPLQYATNLIKENMDAMLDVKGQTMSRLYGIAGVPTKAPLFAADRLEQVARNAISDMGSPTAQEKVLSFIRNYRSEASDAAGQLLDARGNPVQQPAKRFTVDELREIKDELAQSMTPPNGQLTKSQEAVINRAYGAIRAEQDAIVAEELGTDVAKKFSSAQEYAAQFFEAYRNPLIRQLENPNQRGSIIQGVANGIANTDFTQFMAYNKLVQAVNKGNPALAGIMAKPLKEAVRVSFIQSATEGTRVNIKKLADNLALAARTGKEYGFDSNALGLGDARAIDNWQRLLRKNGIRDLTTDEANTFFSNPTVQMALAGGATKAQTAALTRATAELAFNREANRAAAMLALTRANSPQARLAAQSIQREALKLAGNQVQAQQLLARAENNPLTVAINALRANADIASSTKAAQDVTTQLTQVILNSDPRLASQLRAGLLEEARRTPSFSAIPQMIETRLIKDALIGFEAAASGVGKQMDARKFADFFNPPVGEQNQLRALKQFIDPKRFAELQDAAKAMATISQYQNRVRVASGIGTGPAQAAGLLRGGFESRGNLFTTMVKDLLKSGAKTTHAQLTAAIMDTGFRNALLKHGGNTAAALREIGPARAIALGYMVPELRQDMERNQQQVNSP